MKIINLSAYIYVKSRGLYWSEEIRYVTHKNYVMKLSLAIYCFS